jgi:hypothetical protein
VERNAGPAVSALREGIAEANGGISLAVAVVILQGHEEAARGRRVVAVVTAAPGIDVDHAIGGDDEVPGVTDVVREHGSTEPRRERDSPVVARAGRRHGVLLILRSQW